jgi:hypothetical protein
MNSTCENGCIDGYWGDSCFYTCPVNCINCEQNSPSVCDKCHDGYYNGFWHDGNSYGPWTDNCINKCNPQCKSCYYYQHCKECADGYYKTKSVENCTLPCPQRCVSCISESDCTACKPGYFGINCSQICSKGCDTVECDKKTGSCNCTSNYMGETCRYCKHEKFGTNCDLECPENCLVCNQSDSCLYCKPGYEGPLCSQPNGNSIFIWFMQFMIDWLIDWLIEGQFLVVGVAAFITLTSILRQYGMWPFWRNTTYY